MVSYWERGLKADFDPSKIKTSAYRMFCKEHLYWGNLMIHRRGQWDDFFPAHDTKNLVICISCVTKEHLSVFITNCFVDTHFNGDTQAFPQYYYTKKQTDDGDLFDSQSNQFKQHDAITDFILNRCREMYGPKVTKNDIFYYVYGILHSEDYRKTFSADLKKMLPRIPLVESPADFKAFVKAGKELAALHLNYETQPEPDNVAVKGEDMLANNYTVQKMTFAKKRNPETGKMEDDRSTIVYNHKISVVNIPAEAYDYIVNGKSAIEWVMERYQITTNKDTGIVNDPNAWAKEHDNPRYILTLLLSVINVSIKTRRIVAKLPALKF